MKRLSILIIALIVTVTGTAYAHQPQQSQPKQQTKQSIIDQISLKSQKLYVTTKNEAQKKTQHVIKLSQKQWNKLHAQGAESVEELKSILKQYHFQWPVAKDKKK